MGRVRLCQYCQRPTEIVNGDVIYPHRLDLFDKKFHACLPCKAWVGCHPGTDKRMGLVANAATRRLKMKAHESFDELWLENYMTRKDAYKWLQKVTGLSKADAHIGWMDDAMLKKIPALVAKYIESVDESFQ